MTQRTFKVAVLGATGMVGQRFIRLIDGHPWFKLTEVVASERSAGKTYRDAASWVLNEPIPRGAGDLEVKLATDELDVDLCFSAIPAGTAGPIESDLAKRGYKVFTNARDHRWDDDVPLLLPEVNPDHLQLVKRQGRSRDRSLGAAQPGKLGPRGDGFIVTNGNCSTAVMAMTLRPLADAFGIRRVNVTTFQALSGAGYPGVPSLQILNNVVPHIGGEEQKMEREPRRMLGRLTDGGGVELAGFTVSATCVRVPVEEGHSEDIRVELARDASPEEVADAFRTWNPRPQQLKLPSAPTPPLVVWDAPDRPQPRKDWSLGGAMAVSVGRIRADPHMTVKYWASGSNTVRGAAGGNVLCAELAVAEGYV